MEQKVSFITTVRNESDAIISFLDSLRSQTRKPDEIIIVDAGSTDDTVSKIKEYSQPKIHLIVKKGNRSIGRNTAIKKARNNIIAVSDVGCILDKNWLERITKPFVHADIDIVSGFYKPVTSSVFERCLATYTCTMSDQLDRKNFLPSSRSIAFRKRAWEKVKGYPENLDTCEDLVFDRKLKREGFLFETQEKALVYWPQRKNIYQATRQFFSYAVGDGKARFIRPNTYLLFLRYIVGFLLIVFILGTKSYSYLPLVLLLVSLYLLWAIGKNYKYVREESAFFYLPLLQMTSDIAVISGTIIGTVENIWGTQDKR